MTTIYHNWCREDLIAELENRDDRIESLIHQLRKAGEDIATENAAVRQEDIRDYQAQVKSDLNGFSR